MRHFRLRAAGTATAAVALTVLAAACSSSTSSGTGSTGSSSTGSSGSSGSSGSAAAAPVGGNQALNPGSGTPKYGGTLNEVGVSDVKVMDYDLA
ncbi:MAG: hypothetical protein ACRDNS_29400, partial [Trebonia sp.]